MTVIKRVKKASCSLAVAALLTALSSSSAFAGEARYLGSHGAGDSQITGTILDLGAGTPPANVNYTGTVIEISSDDDAQFSGLELPNQAGTGIHLTGDGTFTAVIDAIDFGGTGADAGFVGLYLDELAPASSSQVFLAITPDGAGGYVAGIGIPGSDNTLTSQTAFTLPVTIIITRTGAAITATVNGAAVGAGVTMALATVDHFPRLYLETRGTGDPLVSFSSITVEGVGIPDVNLPRVNSIDRIGAVGDITSGWTVTFSEPVTGVTVDDFTLDDDGDFVGGALTLTAVDASTYTLEALDAVGAEGSLALDFNDGTDVATVSDSTSIPGFSGTQKYRLSSSVPAAGLLGLGLVASALAGLGAAATRRRKD